jgi:hypothetical protein
VQSQDSSPNTDGGTAWIKDLPPPRIQRCNIRAADSGAAAAAAAAACSFDMKGMSGKMKILIKVLVSFSI